mmetsp:Transcript_58244/g.138643  ORF Transcript_58244/g.138643 Transcript_58244/m.138643 type:complete len:246 (-) Transcript_58244:315-1052(-)
MQRAPGNTCWTSHTPASARKRGRGAVGWTTKAPRSWKRSSKTSTTSRDPPVRSPSGSPSRASAWRRSSDTSTRIATASCRMRSSPLCTWPPRGRSCRCRGSGGPAPRWMPTPRRAWTSRRWASSTRRALRSWRATSRCWRNSWRRNWRRAARRRSRRRARMRRIRMRKMTRIRTEALRRLSSATTRPSSKRSCGSSGCSRPRFWRTATSGSRAAWWQPTGTLRTSGSREAHATSWRWPEVAALRA